MTYYGSKRPKITLFTEDNREIDVNEFGDYKKYGETNASIKMTDGYMQVIVPISVFPAFMQEYFNKQQQKFMKIYSDVTGDLAEMVSLEDQVKALEIMSKVKYQLEEG